MANLLQHEIERYGAVTVMDVMLLDYETKEPAMFLDTLKISTITAESELKEIKGGQYADTLITYDFGRTIGIEFQDALLSSETMKNIWGAVINNAATGFHIHQREIITVAADDTITVDFNIAMDGSTPVMLKVYDADGKEVVLITPTYSNNTVVSTVLDAGVYTVYYVGVAPVDTSDTWPAIEALIKSDSFPKTVTFVGKTFFINQKNGKKIEAEIEIPKLKLMANFTLGLEAEGDASVFDFSGMALVNGAAKELIKIKTIRYID